MTPTTRALTNSEKGCLNMLKSWEQALKERRLSITLKVPRPAAELIGNYDNVYFRVMKTEFNPASMDYVVSFTLVEFRRYINFILPRCGMTLQIDGSVMTLDNLHINNSYLGSEMEPRK